MLKSLDFNDKFGTHSVHVRRERSKHICVLKLFLDYSVENGLGGSMKAYLFFVVEL